jgi:hypothetical protein
MTPSLLRSRPRGLFFLLLTALPLFWVWPRSAAAETVRVPLSLDYPLVRSLLVQRAFTGSGESTLVLDELDGCTWVELSQPQVTPVGDRLSVACRIKVRAGASVFNKCLKPVEWEGYIELLERPYLEPHTWLLRLNTEESRLYDREQGQPAKVAQIIWDVVKTHVHGYLDNKVSLSLAPPVKDLNEFVPLIFHARDQAQVKFWLASLRPGAVQVGPSGLKADLVMQVEPEQAEATEGRLHISQADLERFIAVWQQWDVFLVLQINALSRHPLSEGERRVLLETLLDARYRFVQELNDLDLGRKDVVREQFVTAWIRLAPVMRRHLERETGDARLSYLAFFSAADTLAALDKLGPTLSLEISRNGLIRLARLLTASDNSNLPYSWAVDPGLRRTLGMGPALDEAGPSFMAEEMQPPAGALKQVPPAASETDPSSAHSAPEKRGPASFFPWSSRLGPLGPLARLGDWLVRPAWASLEMPPAAWQEIKSWLLTTNNREIYLERIKEALRLAGQKAASSGGLPEGVSNSFVNLVKAAAWQESCWRQFIAPGGRVTFLRSSNNTSVGMMQINERIWRGIYNPGSLRWNALYNIKAGTEILHQYLTRYALDRHGVGRALSPDLLAQAIYAMYNAGPGQMDNFLKRQARKAPNLYDRLFSEKYGWVCMEQWDKIERCLGE